MSTIAKRGMGGRLGCLLSFAAALTACGGDPVDTPAPDTTPAACEAGTLETDAGCLAAGIDVCAEGFESNLEGGCHAVIPDVACDAGLVALPGETTCRALSECGTEPYPSVEAGAVVHHVDAAFSGTSDGSAANPWSTIAEAIAAAPDGATIAVAAGQYDEAVTVSKPVSIVGRCASMVDVSTAGLAAFYVTASGASLEGLGITGSQVGVMVVNATDVRVARSWVHDTGNRGIDVEGPNAPASATIEDVLVEGAVGFGVFGLGADVTVRRTAIRGGEYRGIMVKESSLTVEASVIEGNRDHGILLSGASGIIERSVVRATLPDGNAFGIGIGAKVTDDTVAPSLLTVRDTEVAWNHTVGIAVEGSEAHIERTMVRATQPQPLDDNFGVGIQMQDDVRGLTAALTVRQSTVEWNHHFGIQATGGTLVAESTLVRHTQPRAGIGDMGRGVSTFVSPDTGTAIDATLRGLVLEDNHEVGVFSQAGTLRVFDTRISRTHPRLTDGFIGRGVGLQSGNFDVPAIAELDHVLVEDSSETAVYVEGSELTMRRSIVRRTRRHEVNQTFGDAVLVYRIGGTASASATIESSQLVENDRVGVAAVGGAVTLAETQLECNAIDLNATTNAAFEFSFSDGGGNSCGCSGEQQSCKLASEDIAPPEPLQD